MRIILDLNSPDISEKLNAQIEAAAAAIIADKLDGMIESVLETKMGRLTDKRIDELAEKAVRDNVARAFTKPSYNTPSQMQQVLQEEIQKLLKEHLTK